MTDKTIWLCSRCAKRLGKAVEPEPTVLRVCSNCKVENWVRPFGHAGEQVDATDDETEEAQSEAAEEKSVPYEDVRDELLAEEDEFLDEPVNGAILDESTIQEDGSVTVQVAGEEAVDEAVDEQTAEIARLEAELAELKGESE